MNHEENEQWLIHSAEELIKLNKKILETKKRIWNGE
jgi:hypothetical protein